MRVLVAAMPFAAHTAPTQCLARALTARGHAVVGSTGSRHGAGFLDAGAEPASPTGRTTWTRMT